MMQFVIDRRETKLKELKTINIQVEIIYTDNKYVNGARL